MIAQAPRWMWVGVLGGLIVLMAGCTPDLYPLDDVPVRGGSLGQQDAVRTALLSFQDQAGEGRITLREVALDDAGTEGGLGRYVFETQTVFLSPGLGPDALPDLVFHELCHAIDDQEALSIEMEADLGALAPAVLDDELVDPDYDQPGFHRMETFAQLCDTGAPVSSLVQVACPDSGSELLRVHEWMGDTLWLRDAGFDTTAPGVADTTWSTWFEVEQFDLEPGFADATPAFTLAAVGSGGNAFATVDADTGAEVGGAFVERPGDIGDDTAFELEGVTLDPVRGWSAGSAIALASTEVAGSDAPIQRLMVSDGDGRWQIAPDVCPSTQHPNALAALDDRLWFAWATGMSIRWGHWTASR